MEDNLLYEYMVVYRSSDEIGRIEITRTKKIEAYTDIEELDKFISEHNNMPKVMVTDFKLLRICEKES